MVPDARRDPRFAGNPMVVGEPHIRFYAGAPLVTEQGHVLGALCVFDPAAGELDATRRGQLVLLARQVVSQLELRRSAQALAEQVQARVAAEAALHDSARLLTDLLDHSDSLVYVKDLQGRFLVANPALNGLLGRGQGELIGLTDFDLFPAADAKDYRCNDQEIAATGRRQVFTEQLNHPDGTVHDYLSTKFVLTDATGTVYAVAGVSSDVTELTAERAAHAEAEERWKALVEHSPVAVLVADAEGRFRYGNPQALQLLGVARNTDLRGRPMTDFQPDAGPDPRGPVFRGLLSGGPAVQDRRWQVRRTDGTILTVEVNAAAVLHGGMPAVQLEVRDVTSRVRAEGALQEAHEELEQRKAFTDAVLGSVDVGIVACDAQGQLTIVNDTIRRWHGLEPATSPDDTENLALRLSEPDGSPAGRRPGAAAAGAARGLGTRCRAADLPRGRAGHTGAVLGQGAVCVRRPPARRRRRGDRRDREPRPDPGATSQRAALPHHLRQRSGWFGAACAGRRCAAGQPGTVPAAGTR